MLLLASGLTPWGVLQCFDATDTVNLSRPVLQQQQQNGVKSKEPQWSRATGTFLCAWPQTLATPYCLSCCRPCLPVICLTVWSASCGPSTLHTGSHRVQGTHRQA